MKTITISQNDFTKIALAAVTAEDSLVKTAEKKDSGAAGLALTLSAFTFIMEIEKALFKDAEEEEKSE